MSTSVTMKIALSGTSDGKPWPEIGGTVVVSDGEAEHLAAAGYAEVLESGLPDPEPVVEHAEPAKRETRGSTN